MKNYGTYQKCDAGILIIKILKEYTNLEKHMTTEEIKNKLVEKYGISLDPKTVSSTLKRLINLYCNIKYDVKELENGDSKYSNWRYEPLFLDGELRYLIDCIKGNKALLLDDREELCDKIKSLSTTNELDKILLDTSREDVEFEINKKYISNIEHINRAINLGKQIKFKMQVYNIEKNFETVKDENGEEKEYVVIPEDLVIKDGTYYLVATCGETKKYQFKVEKLVEVEILEQNEIKTSTSYSPKEIAKYVEDRVHMFSGDVEEIKLKIKNNMVDRIVTDFDKNVTFEKINDVDIIAIIKTNKRAFDIWVKKYLDVVEILED